MESLIGKSLGRYHILEQLGEGGMATVYKAYDTRLERDVAIKIIRVDQFAPAVLDNVLKRFEREAKALARLTHPNIVHVNDYGEYKRIPYLVMDYVPGGTLKQSLGEPMPWQKAVRLLIPIAEALEYAHEHNVIHRDIKPSNILLAEKGQPMLSDFGIAKILEGEESATLSVTGTGVGTPEYMAPEQWIGKAGPLADLYSLGVVLFELVTGHKPYTADTPAAIMLKQATDPLPRPRQFVPGLPEEIEKVLFKALSKETENRYQNMGEFAAALEKILTGVRTNEAGESRREERGEKEEEAVQNAGGIEKKVGEAAQVTAGMDMKEEEATLLVGGVEKKKAESAVLEQVVVKKEEKDALLAGIEEKAEKKDEEAIQEAGAAEQKEEEKQAFPLPLETVQKSGLWRRWLPWAVGILFVLLIGTIVIVFGSHGTKLPIVMTAPTQTFPSLIVPTFTPIPPAPVVVTIPAKPSTAIPIGRNGIKIGLSFSDFRTERWPIESAQMTLLLQKLGYEVIVQEADHDVKLQSDQIDNMVSQGVKGLIVIAEDGDAAVTPVEKAVAAGVKVIAYDRLIKTSKISAYLSFDNTEVGRNEADGVVKALGLDKGNPTWTKDNPVKMVLSGGSPTDNNAVLVRNGQMEVLLPYIDKGVVKIVADQWVENWDPAKAEAMMENILTAQQNKVDAVVASNDGTALGELQALAAHGLAGKVPISGQDATVDGCNSIVKGLQTVTVLKDTRLLAPRAVEIIDALIKGQTPAGLKSFTIAELTNDKTKTGSVMANFLPVVQITKENVYDLIVKSGLEPYDLVYRDIPANQLPPKP